VARKIGDFQARVLLIVFYFLIFGPFALLVSRVSDPLAIKPNGPRGWHPRGNPEGAPMERARRQF